MSVVTTLVEPSAWMTVVVVVPAVSSETVSTTVPFGSATRVALRPPAVSVVSAEPSVCSTLVAPVAGASSAAGSAW